MKIKLLIFFLLVCLPIGIAQTPPIQPQIAPINTDLLSIQAQLNQIGDKASSAKDSCVATNENNNHLQADVVSGVSTTLKTARILSFLSVFSATFLAFLSTELIKYIVERKKKLIYEKERKLKYGM